MAKAEGTLFSPSDSGERSARGSSGCSAEISFQGSNSSLQIILPQRVGKFFTGVTKHRSWHHPIPASQKNTKSLSVPIADFPEHPSDSFLNQILLVFQQEIRQPEGIFEFSLFDKVEGYHDCRPLLPEISGTGQIVQIVFCLGDIPL